MYFTKQDLDTDSIQWDLRRVGKGFSCWVSSLFYKVYLCDLESGVSWEESKAQLCIRLVMVLWLVTLDAVACALNRGLSEVVETHRARVRNCLRTVSGMTLCLVPLCVLVYVVSFCLLTSVFPLGHNFIDHYLWQPHGHLLWSHTHVGAARLQGAQWLAPEDPVITC